MKDKLFSLYENYIMATCLGSLPGARQGSDLLALVLFGIPTGLLIGVAIMWLMWRYK